jgi:hypothetical protein
MGLTYSSVVRAEPAAVLAWHSRAGAITRLMPPWQPVRVVREAPSVRGGHPFGYPELERAPRPDLGRDLPAALPPGGTNPEPDPPRIGSRAGREGSA